MSEPTEKKQSENDKEKSKKLESFVKKARDKSANDAEDKDKTGKKKRSWRMQ